jgi:hypothetical protein
MDEPYHYNRLAKIMLEHTAGESSDALLYGECQEDAITVWVFYRASDGTVIYLDASDDLVQAVQDFWEDWRKAPDRHEWKVMTFAVKDRKFNAAFLYRDQLNKDESQIHRRRPIVESHFGTTRIIYPKP